MNDEVASHIAERILLAIGNRHEILDFLIDNLVRSQDGLEDGSMTNDWREQRHDWCNSWYNQAL